MKRKVDTVCPYCGHTNKVEAVSDVGQMSPVNCDIMDGGCDCWYMVRLKVNIQATSLRVEGEDISREGAEDG